MVTSELLLQSFTLSMRVEHFCRPLSCFQMERVCRSPPETVWCFQMVRMSSSSQNCRTATTCNNLDLANQLAPSKWSAHRMAAKASRRLISSILGTCQGLFVQARWNGQFYTV